MKVRQKKESDCHFKVRTGLDYYFRIPLIHISDCYFKGLEHYFGVQTTILGFGLLFEMSEIVGFAGLDVAHEETNLADKETKPADEKRTLPTKRRTLRTKK